MKKNSPLRQSLEDSLNSSGLLFLKEDDGVYSFEDTERYMKIAVYHSDPYEDNVRIAFGFIGFVGNFTNMADYLNSKISNLGHAFALIHETIIPRIENGLAASRTGSEVSSYGKFLLNGNCHTVGCRKESKIKRYFESEAQARSFVSLVSEFIDCGEATLYEILGKERLARLKIVFDSGSETVEPLNVFPLKKKRKAS